MNWTDSRYFVFTPEAGDPKNGTFHRLEPASDLPANGLIVIPYVHPAKEKIQNLFFRITKSGSISLPLDPAPTPSKQIIFKASWNKAGYIRQIEALKKKITRGDIYEINFCLEFLAQDVDIDPFTLFHKLCLLSKAPYNYLVKLDQEFILCCSPELYLKKEAQHLITKPIKGTAGRFKDLEQDEHSKDQLYNSLKERTENVMAVDVARNDLSMIAAKASVKVNKLYNIESFETVHQMVSTVSCEIKPGKNFDDIIEASFPMASMTGAPKISAMNLIDQTENFNRKYYSGALGLTENGDYELAVVIRSLFYNAAEKKLSFATGGAITYLSDPEQEYEECLLKAQSMVKAVQGRISSD